MDRTQLNAVVAELKRLADALERRAPVPPLAVDLTSADAFLWHAPRHPTASGMLEPVAHVNRLPLSLLKGIDRVRDILLENTRRFALGFPANNALLWGARGMGKSALIKAVHGAVAAEVWGALAIVEIHREDIESLPELMRILRASTRRVVMFCDDLSFDGSDASYKSLKAVLEGGLEGRPSNVLRPSIRRRPSKRKCRSRTASGCGSASTIAPRMITSPWSKATWRISDSRRIQKRRVRPRSNGRQRAVRARAASPGNSSRISRADWVQP
jgi:predicted AAA+ superfamily ATPase